eukprot:12979.XXX_392936_393235_1 [CDS] Oithona nana genome sequencing.
MLMAMLSLPPWQDPEGLATPASSYCGGGSSSGSGSGCSVFLDTLCRKVDPIACKNIGSAKGVLAADLTSLDTMSSSYTKIPSPFLTMNRLVVPLKLLAD